MAATTIASKTDSATMEGFESIEAKEYYEQTLINAIHDDEDLSEFFNKKKMPKNHGHTYTWRKMSRIEPRTEVLAEGVLPDPSKFSLTEYQTKVADYGQWTKITQNVKTYAIDPLWTEVYNELGYAAKEAFKIKREELLYSTKNRWFMGATTLTGKLSEIRATLKTFDLDELRKIRAFFKRNNVAPFEGGKYLLIVAPEVASDLLTLTKNSTKFTLVEVANYQQNEGPIYSGEIGSVLGFRIIERNALVSRKSLSAGGVDYFTSYALGKTRGLKPVSEIDVTDGVEVIVKPTDSGGVNNALNQVGSIGWKKEGYGSFVLDDAAIVAIESKADTPYYDEYPYTSTSNITKRVEYTGDDSSLTTDIANKTMANGDEITVTPEE